MVVTTSTRSRKPTGPDAACVEAVDLARAAATEAAPGEVGEHLGVEAEDERLVTHRFATTNPGYLGWHWAVTVTRASRAKEVTIDEVVLLPGETAVLAPPFVPWAERLRPGDLGPGDILPPPENDDRLLPGYTGQTDSPYDPADGDAYAGEADLVADELGLGRARVLSPVGRADATDRWYSGERGPEAPIATAAPAQCATCGFLLAMAGSMGRVFGVCANEYAPDDAKVVSFDHGCGAHSEAVATPGGLAERPPLLLDHVDYDLVVLDDVAEVVEVSAAEAAEGVAEVEEDDVEAVTAAVVEIDDVPEGDLLVEVVTEDETEDFTSER
ncbi:DUF3027 domain-containing protein [Sporichthya sp.]|uniref:DUF3027 domain-containing protein n=1 Tax=Sporichthya sp. TaxID=65475 RepID=UPI0017EB2355|nr:DUF3027 domain-containing protein [Sporichthya sp.]MBA3744993.1 DUF3027 domain-containing protein [Sporichthya sp.]